MLRESVKIGFIAGSFDLIHPGYIRMFKESKEVCNYLIVALQDDPTIDRPHKMKPVQTWEERKEVIEAIKYVDEIFTFNDTDGTVCQLLKIIKICYPDADICYISPDDMHNMPETKIKGITFETMK